MNEFVTQGEKPNLAYVNVGSMMVAELESDSGPVAPSTVFDWGYDDNHKYSYTKAFALDETTEKVKFCVGGR